MKAQEWTVVESSLNGVHTSLRWDARIVDTRFPETLRSFALTLCYGALQFGGESPDPQVETLVQRTVSLGSGKRGVLRLTRESRFSLEAIAHPPVRVRYALRLEAQNRLRLTQEQEISVAESDYRKSGSAPLESFLNDEWRDLIRTMEEGKSASLRRIPAVKLAREIIESTGPLGESLVTVRMKACRVVSAGRRVSCTPTESHQLRIPVSPTDSVVLVPSFEMDSQTPFYRSVRTSTRPLPSYAYVVLLRKDGSVREIARATAPPGTFTLGPASLRSYRKLRLEVSLPLQPPGDDVAVSYEVLLRTGRPVEVFLDRGELPPPPPLPEGFSEEQLVSEVVRHVATAVNPDDGSVGDLGGESLLDLLACAESHVNQYPELREICDEAVRERIAWEHSAFARPLRSEPTGEGWTERDALDALDENWATDTLAARLRLSEEPYRELVYTKTEPPARQGADTTSIVPHALAAAALARAKPEEYADLIRSQLVHMQRMHAPEWTKSRDIGEVVRVGQCCKLVAGKTVDAESRDIARTFTSEARHAAFRAFCERSGELPLRHKVDIAHLVSPFWRPYFNVPEPFFVSPREAAPEKPLEQRMVLVPGERDVTGEVLEDARLRYKAALERAIAETKRSKISKKDKKKRMERFLDDWHDYLFNVHKGGYLQPYEEQLLKDRKRALKAIE